MSAVSPLRTLRGALLATCSGLVIALAAPRAEAVSITVGYSYVVGALVVPPFETSSPTGLYFTPSQSSGNNSISGAHWGFDNGVFGTRSSGQGSFEKSGFSRWQNSFTNTGTLPVSLVANFVIEGGSLSTDYYGDSGVVTAGFNAQISVNNSVAFFSTADMQLVDGGVPELDKSGTDLNPSGQSLMQGSGFYWWNTYTGTIDLGLLAPGDSVDIAYLLQSYASSTAAGCGHGGYGGYGGYGGLVASGIDNGDGGTDCFPAYANARIGDPINIDFGPAAFSVSASNVVATPEPASAALLGAGLAGLALRRRRAKA